MLALIAVTPLIFILLVKGNYREAFNQVPILFYGTFFNSIVNFYSGIYIALKRTKQVGYSSIIGAVLNAIINILLISKIGLYAASISTTLSFGIIAFYRAVDLGRVITIKYNFKEIAFGMLAFFISSICLVTNKRSLIMICWIIAIIYNTSQNVGMLRNIARRFLKR